MTSMENSLTEKYLETSIDNSKVTDVVKSFNEDVISKVKNLKQDRLDRISNRTVKSICTGLPICNNYYTSYDDHIKQIDEQIENTKVQLLRGLELIDLLEEKKQNIIQEARTITEETFTLPDYLSKYTDFIDLLKEHIIHKHPKLIGDYYGDRRYTSHAGHLDIEPVYNEKGNITSLRCLSCYREWCRSDKDFPSKDDGVLNLKDTVGSK